VRQRCVTRCTNDGMVWTFTQDMHWTELATTGEPPSPRSGHTAEVWGEWLVVFGGWDGDRHLQDTHLLHLETMHWLQVSLGLTLLVKHGPHVPR
jgi:hypothetical protein